MNKKVKSPRLPLIVSLTAVIAAFAVIGHYNRAPEKPPAKIEWSTDPATGELKIMQGDTQLDTESFLKWVKKYADADR